MDSLTTTEEPSDPTTTEELESPIPMPLFSDYVEMAYLGLVLLIGVPINIHILFKLLKQKEKTARYSVKRGFLILKIHLNISDTLILFINAGGKLGWLITYEWKAGDEMCRIFKFVSIGTLYLSSNIVVCIALDRLRTVLSARQLRRENSVLPTKIILVLAWLLALASSIPQYFAFQSFDVLQFSEFKDTQNWYQCTDIWTVNDHLIEKGYRNDTESFPFTEITKNFHELFHLFMVFYGPLIVMAVCYFIIAVKLTNYSKGNPHSGREEVGGGGGSCVRSKYLKPAIAYDLDETSEISRISLDSAYGDLKHGKLTVMQFLKKEFSYCICFSNNSNITKPSKKEAITFPRVPSARNLIHEDPVSSTSFGAGSTNLFTWTPLLHSKKLGHESRSPSFNKKIQRLTTLRRAAAPPSSSSASTSNGQSKKQAAAAAASLPKQPAWRRQLRSRVFKTTLLVVVTHIIFWLPYNFISLLRFVSIDLHTRMRNHMNIFEDLQFLIAIVNPFLYGFGESLSRY